MIYSFTFYSYSDLPNIYAFLLVSLTYHSPFLLSLTCHSFSPRIPQMSLLFSSYPSHVTLLFSSCHSPFLLISLTCLVINFFLFLITVTRDVTLEERRCTIQRRHSIMVCQSPTSPMAYKVPHVAQETLTEENENENIPVTYRRPIDQQNEDVIKNSNVPRNLGNDGGKSLLSELNASELMHVSWKTACTRLSNCGGTCPDCRPVPVST